MCGRYYIDDETTKEIRKIVAGLEQKQGEVYPSQKVPIMLECEQCLTAEELTWGFPNYHNKGLLINARSETVITKKTFRESVLHERCIIPAAGFYEWDKKKEKVYFTLESEPVLFMAGLYHSYQGVKRFVILTTGANESMEEVHDRMPLIVSRTQINDWILDATVTNDILHQVPPLLIQTRNYEQLKFDL